MKWIILFISVLCIASVLAYTAPNADNVVLYFKPSTPPNSENVILFFNEPAQQQNAVTANCTITVNTVQSNSNSECASLIVTNSSTFILINSNIRINDTIEVNPGSKIEVQPGSKLEVLR